MVDGVLSLLFWPVKTKASQVVNFFLPAEAQVADGRDDAHLGRQQPEGEVKAHLIIAGTGAAVRQRSCTYAACIASRLERLKYALSTYGQGVGMVAQRIAINEKTQALFIKRAGHIRHFERGSAQRQRTCFHFCQLLRTKAAGVNREGMYFQPFFLCEVFDTKRSIQPAAIGEHDLVIVHTANILDRW